MLAASRSFLWIACDDPAGWLDAVKGQDLAVADEGASDRRSAGRARMVLAPWVWQPWPVESHAC